MKRLPGVEGRPTRGPTGKVFRMQAFGPASSAFLLRCTTTIFEPKEVKELALTIGSEPPHHGGCGIGNVLEMTAILGNR
jgi:hypothetical protein